MKKTSTSYTVMHSSVFSYSAMFYGTFSSMNNFICQNNTLSKANQMVSKSRTALKHVASNTGRKFLLPNTPGHWETPGERTRRVDKSVEFLSLSYTLRGETFAGRKFFNFCKFWTSSRKFDLFFVKIRENLSHAKWTSNGNLMKIEIDLLEYS